MRRLWKKKTPAAVEEEKEVRGGLGLTVIGEVAGMEGSEREYSMKSDNFMVPSFFLRALIRNSEKDLQWNSLMVYSYS